jgi:hypothetical protein
VSGLNLATPDARHRRPLKFFIPSKCKKATPVPKGEMSFKKCPTSVRRGATLGIPRGICISHLFLRKRPNEVLEKMLERHRSAESSLVVRKAFFDLGRSLKDQSKNRRKLDGKFRR